MCQKVTLSVPIDGPLKRQIRYRIAFELSRTYYISTLNSSSEIEQIYFYHGTMFLTSDTIWKFKDSETLVCLVT